MLVLVKIGGSFLTDKVRPMAPRTDRIQLLAQTLKRISAKRLILGHGSGSFGHYSASKFRTAGGLKEAGPYGGAHTRHVASLLNKLIIDALIENEIPAASFPPSAGAIAEKGRIVEWNLEPIERALEIGWLPVVYGDVVIDRVMGFSIASTEEVLRFLAENLPGRKRIVFFSDVDGVYTADPKKDPDARLIPEITPENVQKVLKLVGVAEGYDVTGGMRQKILYLLRLSKFGEVILTGKDIKNLEAAIEGKKFRGTVFKAQ